MTVMIMSKKNFLVTLKIVLKLNELNQELIGNVWLLTGFILFLIGRRGHTVEYSGRRHGRAR